MDLKISQLPKLEQLEGAETIPVVSNGVNYTVEVNQISSKEDIKKIDAEVEELSEHLLEHDSTFTSIEGEISDIKQDYATKQHVEERFEELIGTAPENLDTLGEIAEALKDNDDAVAGIVTTLAQKVSKEELESSLSGTKYYIDNQITSLSGDINSKVDSLNDSIDNKADSSELEEVKENVNTIFEKIFFFDEGNAKGWINPLPEYVDLGLPSGLLWATCNLGAESETDYGLYYQWGDVKGYKTACAESESDSNDNAHYFDWSKYKFGPQDNLTKYRIFNIEYRAAAENIVLEAEDDAAVAALGGQWRMPTEEEFQELIDNTDPGDGANEHGWIENYNGNNVNGLLRKSKTNNNTIFFAGSGGGEKSDVSGIGYGGMYWTSSLYKFNDKYGQSIMFMSNNIGTPDAPRLLVSSNYRYYGMSIRPVKPSK